MRHALSFDVEEYFQVSNFEDVIPREAWPSYPSRLVASTERVLGILSDHGVRATFFLLGWNAERHPDLVRTIASLGHEVASHGYSHRLVYDCAPEEFRDDVRRTRLLLEQQTGRGVKGYRAPSFSITPRSSWALSILAEEGYGYDSSIFPVAHPRYGWRGAPADPHVRHLDGGRRIVEFPPTTATLLGARLPAAGGGYLRLFPPALIRRGLRGAARRGVPGVIYLHPWELDPDQPRIPGSRLARWRHYVGLRRTEGRLRRLLEEFSFGPLGDLASGLIGGGRGGAGRDSATGGGDAAPGA